MRTTDFMQMSRAKCAMIASDMAFQIEQQQAEIEQWKLSTSKNADCIREQFNEIAELKALAKKMADALEGVVVWDKGRKLIIPYRVRDPVHSSLSAYRELIKE